MLGSLLSTQLVVAAVVAASIYALIATGLNLVYGTLRLLNVAHGDLVMIGGYVAFWAASLLGISPLWSLWAALALGAAFGVALYQGVFARVIGNARLAERLESNSLLVFFGLSVILQNLASMAFSNNMKAYRYLDQVVAFGAVSMSANRLLACGLAIVALCATLYVLRFTTLGLASRAVMQNREAAAIVGANVRGVYLFSFAAGFALATLAGVLVSMYEQIQPFMGFPFTVGAFIVIMLGGLGNVVGGLWAALLLGLLETYGLALVGSSFRSLLLYGAFVLLLIFRPQGLFAKRGHA
jgi:branched-chain amino acid transport system permease protein